MFSRIDGYALLAVVLAAAFPSGVWGQPATGIMSPGTKGHNHSLEVQSGWVLGQGYRPVRTILRSGAVATDDRVYTIEIEVNDYYRRRSTTTTDQLVIPSGSRVGSVVTTVPQFGLWLQTTVRVYEGSRHLDKLDNSFNVGNVWNFQGLPMVLPTFLYISDRSIDTSLLPEALAINDQNNAGNVNYYANLNSNTVNGRAQYPADLFTQIPLADLPRRWLDYSSVDVICVSADDLAKLADKQPEILKSIGDSISAGGNLWIWGAGDNWERLAEIEQQLKLWSPGAPAWRDPQLNDLQRGLDGGFLPPQVTDYSANGTPIVSSESASSSNSSKTAAAPKSIPFRIRDVQFGRVLVFSGDKPIGANPSPAADVDNWVWAMNSVGAPHMQSKRRQGASMTDDNPDFWQLMIPGVGRAPVTAFRVLITVFVVAIGPINYFFLKRKGKLHLLLAVVPITALLVTGGLFAYALLTDGLQVRVRPRSFTSIDQQRQHAASWARMTYYAGLSPASGLQFDADTAVLPIDAHAGNNYNPVRRKMGWEGDRQRFSSGWLYSRTPTQFLSIRSRPTTAGLRVKPAADGGAPAVTNALGTKLLHLYLRDEQGRLYLSKETERGAVCKLVEAGDEPDIADLRMLLSSRAPALMQDMQLTDVAYYSGSFRSYAYYGQNTFTPSQREGLLEESYRMVDDWLRLPATFPPRNYIAVVEESPEVDFGLEAPQQVLPMHVIHGQW